MRARSAPVTVIGASLAGLAAAARLAKVGHHVTLLEATDRLGGAWAAREMDQITVDTASPIVGFPAPWRDLFRKSGRTLEAEFARQHADLTPAPPARHRFPDGSELELPTGRGDQQTVLTQQLGRSAAAAWCRLVDEQSDNWQLLRRLGIESELTHKRQLPKAVRRTLRHRQTLAELAETLPDPRLSSIVADLGYRQGSLPGDTPAFVAVQLYLEQAFGRWTAGSASTMIDILANRLKLRGVQLQTAQPARSIDVKDNRVAAVGTDRGGLEADAVISTCDPFQLYDRLLSGQHHNPERRSLHRLPAALVPAVAHRWSDTPPVITETVTHRTEGGPLIEYTQPVTDNQGNTHTVLITHDYRDAGPDPTAGVSWRGFRSWLDRPPVTSRVRGLFTAGPFSRGGALPSAQVLSGALACYGAQLVLDPDRPLQPR